MQKINPTQTAAWQALEQHKDENLTISQLFAENASRFNQYSLNFANQILVDYSKNAVNDKTLGLLRQLADECQLTSATEAMFSGQKINRTENRAVLHTALRNRSNTPVYVDGKDVMPEVNAVLAKMKDF